MHAHEPDAEVPPSQIQFEMRDLPMDLEQEDIDRQGQEEEDLSEKGRFDDSDFEITANRTEALLDPEYSRPEVIVVDAVQSRWDYVPAHAFAAIRRIAEQFRLNPEATAKLFGAFDHFLECGDSEIPLSVQSGRYIWYSESGLSSDYRALARACNMQRGHDRKVNWRNTQILATTSNDDKARLAFGDVKLAGLPLRPG
jgi:hypothetical protein